MAPGARDGESGGQGYRSSWDLGFQKFHLLAATWGTRYVEKWALLTDLVPFLSILLFFIHTEGPFSCLPQGMVPAPLNSFLQACQEHFLSGTFGHFSYQSFVWLSTPGSKRLGFLCEW